jgi:hypothetical protein
MVTVTAKVRGSPLERAHDRLRSYATTSEACFDDLAVPTYAEFQASRRSFLDRLTAQAPLDVTAALATQRGDQE